MTFRAADVVRMEGKRQMRILVTTDGSEHSLSALPHAARLADATGAKLLLTRVLDKRQDLASELAPSLKEAARAVTARWEGELKAAPEVLSAGADPSVFPMERREDMPTAINRVSKELRADVVMMATRGAGAMRHALLGSVSMAVLGKSDVPVILAGAQIQPPTSEGPYHIMVTTDGSDASAMVWPVIREVFKKVTTVSIRVTVLQVFEPKSADQPDHLAAVDSEWQLSKFRELAPSRLHVGTVTRKVEPGEKVENAIVAAAQEAGADSLWMATQGHSVAKHVLLGSTALGVLNQSTIPVCLVPTKK